MAKKIIIPKEERQKYYDSILHHASFEGYTADLSENRKRTVVSDLISYCYCFQSVIDDLMVDEEEVKEKITIFEKYLFDNDLALATVESRIKTVRSFYRFNGFNVPKKCEVINKTYLDDIRESKSWKKFLAVKRRAPSTEKRYLSDLSDYCHFNDMRIDDLIAEADDEEERGVRINKRTVKARLISFRGYLRDKGYAKKQINTRFRNVKTFYKNNDIEIPSIPTDTEQYDRQLRYDEVPTKEHIKRALEASTSLRNKALYLFMATSGCASAETRTFTVKEWMLGTKDFHGETTDIQRALNKMDGEMEFIPAFPIVREKKNLDFYTLITPEANQYIVNWLKTRDNLTLDDFVFDMSEDALGYAYKSINDKMGWGKVKDGRHRFFSSHQMRRFHFNVFGIENKDFAHTIEGRKFSQTEEGYWTRNPEKLKKKYRKEEFFNELTIFQKYKVKDIHSKEFIIMEKQMADKDEELKRLNDENEALKQQTMLNAKEIEETKQFLSAYTAKKNAAAISAVITKHIPKALRGEDMATQGVILRMALKYAIENKAEFEYSDEYLDNLINKMKIKIALSDKSVQELFDELEINVVEGITNNDYDKPINDIMDAINDNEQLTNILGNINYEELKPIIEAHLKQSEYDINNLSDNDKSKIIESVLMEYL